MIIKNTVKYFLGVAFVFGLLFVGGQNTLAVSPTVMSLSANPSMINSGENSTIAWSSSNASSCVGTNGGNTSWAGSRGFSGNFPVINLTTTTTFGIYCTDMSGQQSPTVYVTITVNTPPPQQIPTVTLTANPTSVSYNGTTTLSWNVSNATSCTAGGYWSGNKNANGGTQSIGLLVTDPTVFTLNCTGPGGTNSASTSVSVGSQPTPAPTVTLTANPTSVSYNGTSIISWNANNAMTCAGNGGSSGWQGAKNNSGGSFTTNNLTTNTTFNIFCNGYSGSGVVMKSVTVYVGSMPPPPQAPTVTLTANPTSIPYNGTSIISWNSNNATSCNATGGINNWNGQKNINGTFYTGNLINTTTYSITCVNSNGEQANASITVFVNSPPLPPPPYIPPQPPPYIPPQQYAPTVIIKALKTDLAYNEGTDIYWYPSQNTTSCIGTGGANGWAGPKSIYSNYFYTGQLKYTTTFSITCSNSYGQSSNSVTIFVANEPYYPPSVNTNSATNIGTNYATLNGLINSNNNNNVNAWFEWGVNGNYGNMTPQNYYGSALGTNYNYVLGGLNQNTTYYYRAVAQSNNGILIYGNQLSFTTLSNYSGCTYNCGGNTNLPSVTTYSATNINENYALLNGFVDPNGSYSTRWFEWGVNYNNLYNSTPKISGSSYASNFNQSLSGLSPNTIYYFRAAAQNNNGTNYGNTLTFKTTNNNNIIPNQCNQGINCEATTITTLATNIGQTSARLNGLSLSNGNNISTNGYFEWGITQSLGNTTNTGFIGKAQSNPFYSSLFNLSPNTTYYYRAVSTNQYGISKGAIVSFKTNTASTNTNTNTTTTKIIYRDVVTNTNTNTNIDTGGISKRSLVFLNINRNGEIARIGENMDYVVNYKNVSSKFLHDVVLQIAIPQEFTFNQTSRGYFSQENNTIVVDIGNLSPQEEGSVFVSLKTLTGAELGKITVITGNLAYTYTENNNVNNQEEVFAYSKNTIGNGIELGGAALFGGNFLPNTLIGWLAILFIILLIILAVRMAYGSKDENVIIAKEEKK